MFARNQGTPPGCWFDASRIYLEIIEKTPMAGELINEKLMKNIIILNEIVLNVSCMK